MKRDLWLGVRAGVEVPFPVRESTSPERACRCTVAVSPKIPKYARMSSRIFPKNRGVPSPIEKGGGEKMGKKMEEVVVREG